MHLSFRNKLLETQAAWAPEGCAASSLQHLEGSPEQWLWPWLHTALFRGKIVLSWPSSPKPLLTVCYSSSTQASRCPSPMDVSGNWNMLEQLKRQGRRVDCVVLCPVLVLNWIFCLFVSPSGDMWSCALDTRLRNHHSSLGASLQPVVWLRTGGFASHLWGGLLTFPCPCFPRLQLACLLSCAVKESKLS